MSEEIRRRYGLYVPIWDDPPPNPMCGAEGPGRKKCIRAADHTDVVRYRHHRHITWDPSYNDWEPNWDFAEKYGPRKDVDIWW